MKLRRVLAPVMLLAALMGAASPARADAPLIEVQDRNAPTEQQATQQIALSGSFGPGVVEADGKLTGIFKGNVSIGDQTWHVTLTYEQNEKGVLSIKLGSGLSMKLGKDGKATLETELQKKVSDPGWSTGWSSKLVGGLELSGGVAFELAWDHKDDRSNQVMLTLKFKIPI